MQRSMRNAVVLLTLVTLAGPAHAQSPGSVPDTIDGRLGGRAAEAGPLPLLTHFRSRV